MINAQLQTLLVVGSLCTLSAMLYFIHSSKMMISDAIFWIIFSIFLLLLAIFPRISFFAARILGIQSPINFVLLFIIFVLVIQLFSHGVRLSVFERKIRTLSQKSAIETFMQKKGAASEAEQEHSDDD